jgi:hypothetical protein
LWQAPGEIKGFVLMMTFHSYEVAEMDEGEKKNQKGDAYLRAGAPKKSLHP